MENHIMKLNPSPFQMIREGKKTIELRLYDEKRQRISVGDTITFVNVEDSTQTIFAEIKNLFVFDSFEALYQKLPLLECGYTEENLTTASPCDMEVYYSKEQQKQYGVVGIEIEVL